MAGAAAVVWVENKIINLCLHFALRENSDFSPQESHFHPIFGEELLHEKVLKLRD
eukprot:TRINITY_DN6969_c0_g1_i1.p4 TRINITY_DN6969_c0_g1~~TRINITY_DN6969_c0_g1_i1.p4  ORF type:complete len:55 (-),score=12.60 TRINITY_DN6969_c0_g1_i1:336-500(-)